MNGQYVRKIICAVAAALAAGAILALADFVAALVTTDAVLEGHAGGLLLGFVQSVMWAVALSLAVGPASLLIYAGRAAILRRGVSRWLADGGLVLAEIAIYVMVVGIPSIKHPTAMKLAVQCGIGACLTGLSVAGFVLGVKARSGSPHRLLGALGLATLCFCFLLANQLIYPVLMPRMHMVIIILPTAWVTLALFSIFEHRVRQLKTAVATSVLALIAVVGANIHRHPFADFYVLRMSGYAKIAAMSANAMGPSFGRKRARLTYQCASSTATSASNASSADWTVVILVDTLRADRVFGPNAPSVFADLVAQSRAYTNAHAQFGCTDYSVRSMLASGYDLDRHGRDKSLASGLRAAGVGDVAVAATAVTRRFYEAAGLTPIHPTPSADDDAIIEQATQWLISRVGHRTFLWVHLLGAHELGIGDQRSYEKRVELSAARVTRFISDIDKLVGRSGATIVVMGDHGESLGAHGLGEHCATAYEAVAHVPLLIRGPEVAPSKESNVVELIDIAPTLLALQGAPCSWCTGDNLLLQQSSDSCAVHISSVIGSQVIGLTCQRWKLIDDRTFGFAELYDLSSDPTERDNVAAEHPQLVEQLRTQLEAYLRSTQVCRVGGK